MENDIFVNRYRFSINFSVLIRCHHRHSLFSNNDNGDDDEIWLTGLIGCYRQVKKVWKIKENLIIRLEWNKKAKKKFEMIRFGLDLNRSKSSNIQTSNIQHTHTRIGFIRIKSDGPIFFLIFFSYPLLLRSIIWNFCFKFCFFPCLYQFLNELLPNINMHKCR